MDFIPVSFFASSDLVIVGSNLEAADWSNPNGNIYGTSSYVIAEDAAGNRVRLFVKAGTDETAVFTAAEKQAAALNARLGLGKLPVNFSSWEHARPAYGSEAHECYGEDDDLAWERECL